MKKSMLLPMLCAFILNATFAKPNPSSKTFVSIETLIKKNMLHAKIKGVGGYQENCIVMNLENKTKDTLRILVESGRRLVSKDTGTQDILIVKEKNIVLPPYSQGSFTCYGFCCESHDHTPEAGSAYDIGYMAPEGWVKLAEMLSRNSSAPRTAQYAIWNVSDNYDLSTIPLNDQRELAPIKKMVTDIKDNKLINSPADFQNDTPVMVEVVPAI